MKHTQRGPKTVINRTRRKVNITLPPPIFDAGREISDLCELTFSDYIFQLIAADARVYGILPGKAKDDQVLDVAPTTPAPNHESKLHEGHFAVKDPQIENLRKPAKKKQ